MWAQAFPELALARLHLQMGEGGRQAGRGLFGVGSARTT